VQKGTPLAVVNTKDAWYGVLMSDGTTGWVSSQQLRISDLRVVSDSTIDAAASDVLRIANSFMGVPYVWGGVSRSGTDCSGFVKQVWQLTGRQLPRTAREQALVGMLVTPDQLAAGDRVYFNCKGGAVDHTGIYVGNGMFIHASTTRGGVALDVLNSPRYRNSFVCARRG